MIDHTYDKRLVERQIRNGNLEQADFDKHIADLQDLTDNADTLEATLYDEEEAGAEEEQASVEDQEE